MLKNKAQIAVSGSLAYDKIMNFPGRFADHILPTQIHQLNLSFLLGSLRQSFGGTAGNIAYNLALLEEKPIILAVVGSDFYFYKEWLEKQSVDLSRVQVINSSATAVAHIITDSHDNQIAGFYPGPKLKKLPRALTELPKVSLAIVAPDDPGRMLAYAKNYQSKKIPYIFDPGQAITALTTAALKTAVKGAKVLIGNDYEIKLITKRLNITLSQLTRKVDILVITKGEAGSEIYQGDKKIKIKPAKPKNASDPTGAGDAYRAGLIKGLINGYNLKTCGQLAALVAVYTVEKYGTQTHRFSLKELRARYYSNFKEKLVIS